jgi:hypothetical protein
MSSGIRKLKSIGKWYNHDDTYIKSRQLTGGVSMHVGNGNITVDKLIKRLSEFPPNAVVTTLSDDEEDFLEITSIEKVSMTPKEIISCDKRNDKRAAWEEQRKDPRYNEMINQMYERSLANRQNQIQSGVLVEQPDV